MRYRLNSRSKAPGAAHAVIGSAARALVAACPKSCATPLSCIDGDVFDMAGLSIFLKDESGRFGLGSFKALGGIYAVLRTIEAGLGDGSALPAAFGSPAWRDVARATTFTCATDGNHGRAVAVGARMAGARSVVFVHDSVAPHRVAAIALAGADVRIVDGHYDAAVAAADDAARTNGWVLASDTSYPGCEDIPRLVVEGYSVIVDEVIDALSQTCAPRLTHVFVQAGVGGLAAAVTSRMRDLLGADAPTLVVVEPDEADCLYQTAVAGGIASATGSMDTSMAMLACREPSHHAWETLRREAAAFMTVSDQAAENAAAMLDRHRIPTSPSGAAGLAGLVAAWHDPALQSALRLDGARVLIIVTEGPNHRQDAFDQPSERLA